MGLDFIRRAARSFTKGWDRSQKDLAQPTLFTRYPECRTRTINSELNDHVHVTAGEQVMVCVQGDALTLVRETTQIGVVNSPPPDLFRAVRDAGDCALGHVVQINPLSRTADVEIE
jgi:hypothetical protein